MKESRSYDKSGQNAGVNLAHVREGIRGGPGASGIHEVDERALFRRETDSLVPHLRVPVRGGQVG